MVLPPSAALSAYPPVPRRPPAPPLWTPRLYHPETCPSLGHGAVPQPCHLSFPTCRRALPGSWSWEAPFMVAGNEASDRQLLTPHPPPGASAATRGVPGP